MPSLLWFTRDLRVHDNPALKLAADSDMLLCTYVVDPDWFRPGRFQSRPMGEHRWRFLWQSLMALEAELKTLGQRLHIAWGNPVEVIPALCQRHGVSVLMRSRLVGSDEAAQWQQIVAALPKVQAAQVETQGLFRELDLPFALEDMPETFSQFRKKVERPLLPPRPPVDPPRSLPPAPGLPEDDRGRCPQPVMVENDPHQGGEQAALAQLEDFLFTTQGIATYKETRNALDDWSASSRFSPWLANGSLSVRRAAARIADYERQVQRNDSTYWLYFELLWREFFHWNGQFLGDRLFSRDGVSNRARAVSFYPHRFRAWCEGTTQYPIVNACMNQLRETGYMSNRGRQLVASCFVHELGLDWRYGAAWFEEQLVDYDPASNYGNWQYLAGVGADPRGLRQFNLEKQGKTYDPRGDFVERWQGNAAQPVGLHTVDAADWPVAPGDPLY
ncbi:MAG: DASH family cryptochrome [Halomonadaceae bacterium]|nr:MAG: DASH family cryptochrome [Halomonadaceae bacterium]